MGKDKIEKILVVIEQEMGIFFPMSYKRFLSEKVKDNEPYEVRNGRGDVIYIYNFLDVEERNKSYSIQDDEPNYFLIGQDGDTGYFLYVKEIDDTIYSLDLGALGSLDMEEVANNIYDLGK